MNGGAAEVRSQKSEAAVSVCARKAAIMAPRMVGSWNRNIRMAVCHSSTPNKAEFSPV